jgi:cytochrome c oxidase subunit 3
MNTPPRLVLDVSELPNVAIDHRSPIWWGNTLLLVIETVMFALLAATYFYVRMNFEQWPPPQTNYLPADLNPVPDLWKGTLTLVLLLAMVPPMIWSDRAALRMDKRGALLGSIWVNILGVAAIAARIYEFGGLKFRWDDNVYGSILWSFLVLHLLHMIIGTIEDAFMTGWMLTHELDAMHARDVRVTALYVYWVSGIWVPLYAIIYFGPSWL